MIYIVAIVGMLIGYCCVHDAIEAWKIREMRRLGEEKEDV